MKLKDTTPQNINTYFYGTVDNHYKYRIGVKTNKVYNFEENLATFNLLWEKEDFIIAGRYLSTIILTFTTE